MIYSFIKKKFKDAYYSSLPKHTIMRAGDGWLYIDPFGDVYKLESVYDPHGCPLVITLVWRR